MMNKTLSTILLVALILILTGGAFFAGTVYARSTNFGMWSMMGRYGRGGMTLAPGAHLSWRTVPGNAGVNMMGNFNQGANSSYGPGGMMGGNGGMLNMMDGYGYNNSDLTPLTVEQATSAAEKYLANLENADLQIAEVMIFANNAYIVVKETSTGMGAFELLADSSSQTAYPEHGPNMMWNVKYGGLNHEYMMGGNGGMMSMMGGFGWDTSIPAEASAKLTVSPEQAIEYAQAYLDANISGAVAATDPINFYGYYTLDFEKDGKIAGMLSVHGDSGQIFLHTWHGTFIEESEIQ
jgi:hypothetical protein